MDSISGPGDPPPLRLLRSNAPPSPETLPAQKLFDNIRKLILEAQESADLLFEDIPTEIGLLVTDSLREGPDIEGSCARISYDSYRKTIDVRVMSTFVHDAHQPWIVKEMLYMLRSGFLTQSESDSVMFLVGTTFQGFRAPYVNSSKEPDTCLLPDAQQLPSIVIETGWSDSLPKLHRARDLWLQGGFPDVQLVILIKWSKFSINQVKATVEIYGRDGVGTQLLHTEVLFPAPANSALQTIPVTRGQLLGASLSARRNSTDVYHLSLDRFRVIAEKMVRRMGLTPST